MATTTKKSVAGVNPRNHESGKNDAPFLGGTQIQQTITVLAPIDAVYAFWRQLTSLPRFMKNLASVQVLSPKRSHWVVHTLLDKIVEWDAVIIEDITNERISWRSAEQAEVDNAGSVRFKRAPADRGTEVTVTLSYNPPAGKAGELVAGWFGKEPAQQIREDLRRFKELMETGEIPTAEMRPTGAEKISDATPAGSSTTAGGGR